MSITEIFEQLAQKEQDLKTELEKSYTTALQTFFEQAPEGTSFVWVQYTPYFNDGDPCEFRIYSPEVKLGLVKKDDEEDEEDEEDEYAYGEYDQVDKLPANLKEDAIALCQFIEGHPDLMLSLYGDHASIRVNKNGVEVEEYSHD